MECPDCGYFMTPFDTECPRCRRYPKGYKCPKCGTFNTLSDASCSNCKQNPKQPALEKLVQPPPSPVFSLGVPFASSPIVDASPTDVDSSPSKSVLPVDYLNCPVCRNPSVQKVSVICQTGTWSGKSQGTSLGAALGPDGAIPVLMSNVFNASGATHLAQMLSPPQKPRYDSSVGNSNFIAFMFLLILGLYILSLGIGLNFRHWWSEAFVLILGVGMIAGAIYIRGETENEDKAEEIFKDTIARWEAAMLAWNRLFYCPRCGHIYDPGTGAYAPAQQMHKLL